MRILVTAFEPFGGNSVNASMGALEALPETIPAGNTAVSIVKAVIPVVFGRCGEVLDARLSALCPDGVICLGMAAGRGQITPEIFAHNARYAQSPDNAGQSYPVLTCCDPAGPAAYRATFPAEKMVTRLRENGIPAALSFSAGTYVCNDLFYHLMAVSSVPAGFIHVPQAAGDAPADRPSMPQADIDRGILTAAAVLAEHLTGTRAD